MDRPSARGHWLPGSTRAPPDKALFAMSSATRPGESIAGYIGFEATAIYGEESKDPKRTVPMATYAAVTIITVLFAPPSLFSDGFDGGFANWTSANGLTLDAALGAPSVPSARAAVSGSRASASKVLGTSSSVLCMSVRVNLTSIGSSTVSLLRLRTASDAGIARPQVK